MRNKNYYATVGYVVTKFVLPIARKQAKKAAKQKARGAVSGTAGAARRHPARASIIVGAAVGAIGWLVATSRREISGEDDD